MLKTIEEMEEASQALNLLIEQGEAVSFRAMLNLENPDSPIEYDLSQNLSSIVLTDCYSINYDK